MAAGRPTMMEKRFLDPEGASALKELYLSGEFTYRELAVAFGCSKATVGFIITGVIYKEVEPQITAAQLRRMRAKNRRKGPRARRSHGGA